MNGNSSPLQRRLKTAGYLLITGLLIEGITLYWVHPISFLLFISFGGVLIVTGVTIYLLAIVTVT